MPLPQKKLIPTIFLLLVISVIAAPPLWWSSGNPPIIVANAPQNNRGPANIGQAKNMAKSALAALRLKLPAVATQIEADLAPIVDFTVPNPKTPEWIAKQKAPLLLGQLKAMADPFYRRLNTAAPSWLTAERTANGTNFPNSIFPWTSETTDDKNKALANIGQLKAVFSLRFETLSLPPNFDSDGDGLPDDWENEYASGLLEAWGLQDWVLGQPIPASAPANVNSALITQLQSGNLDANSDPTGDMVTVAQTFKNRNPSSTYEKTQASQIEWQLKSLSGKREWIHWYDGWFADYTDGSYSDGQNTTYTTTQLPASWYKSRFGGVPWIEASTITSGDDNWFNNWFKYGQDSEGATPDRIPLHWIPPNSSYSPFFVGASYDTYDNSQYDYSWTSYQVALSRIRFKVWREMVSEFPSKVTYLEIVKDISQGHNVIQKINTIEAIIPPNKLSSDWIDHKVDIPDTEQYSLRADLLRVDLKQRIPSIADDGGETTYDYQSVAAVPWDQPTPGVEITGKEISGDQLTLTAEIYDALTDATEGDAELTPKLWINSRKEEPVAGDVNGVYRLQEYSYQLFPGRNEVTVTVENALGVTAHHMIVVEGDDQQGYEIVEEPPKVPEHPTYPVVYELGVPYMDSVEMLTLKLGGKSVEVTRDKIRGYTDYTTFRLKPFLSVNKPATATPEQISAIPSDKPVFLAELDEDLQVELQLYKSGVPGKWTSPQSGLELTSPEAVEILETGDRNLTLQITARGLGDSPNVKATLETYRGDAAEQNVSGEFQSAYQTAYETLADDAKNAPVTFTVDAINVKDGFNGLSFDFDGGQSPAFQECYHTFRFDSPSKAGVRVFSANLKEDIVLDGVTSRPQDVWYPLNEPADLPNFADALTTSGCQVVGMIDVNGCFDDSPLKRSFLVRGPTGRTFQAFDQLYKAQGRTQRSQTYGAAGANGANLASELDRVQNDAELPESARNALGLEIAETYQFHNGFEDFVPKTHQPYVDPGNGTQQPNSWTMRGSSLPDHPDSNPSQWSVASTLSDSTRAASYSGIIRIDTTADNTAYYATTSPTAPWDLNGSRAISLRFKLLEHDTAMGIDGAFQLAAGDGTRTWTCQVSPTQIRIQGSVISLPAEKFPNGLIDGNSHVIQFNLSGIGNDALVSIDGEVLTTTATAQPGILNGISFGDPGAGISGKFETETLGFENNELTYQYGITDADDYADTDEIVNANNLLLYIRSKGQAFLTSEIATWLKLLDLSAYEWLVEKYTGASKLNGQQELYVFTGKDVWLGSTVDIKETEVRYAGFPYFSNRSKTSHCLTLDLEETKIFSTDQTRIGMQLAGILMAWIYEQDEYKEWHAEREGGGTGIDGLLLQKKHLVENIVKCAKNVETTISLGGEIAASIANEYVDYAITINSMRQGDYMAMVGFIPLVPSSTARVFKIINKADGDVIESIHKLSTKIDDFPSGKNTYTDQYNKDWTLDFDNLYANADDLEAVSKARKLTSDEVINSDGWTGRRLLSTFSNSSVMTFKTVEPIKAYRVYGTDKIGSVRSNFFMFEKPVSKTQVEVDYALGFLKDGIQKPFQNYDRIVEVEIPAGVYIHMGYAAKQTDRYRGGATQFWLGDEIIDDTTLFDWDAIESAGELLPQF